MAQANALIRVRDIEMSPAVVWDVPFGECFEELRADVVWKEWREIGAVVAGARANVVPVSGVGWIDFAWYVNNGRGDNSGPAQGSKRVLADWRGKVRSEVVREVLPLADGWFEYCEREAAVQALAAQQLAADPDSERSGGSDYLPSPGSTGSVLSSPIGRTIGGMATQVARNALQAPPAQPTPMLPGDYVLTEHEPVWTPAQCSGCGALTNNAAQICSSCAQGTVKRRAD